MAADSRGIKAFFLTPMGLFLLALVFRLIDIFALNLDELLGEIILSKSIGIVLVVVYVQQSGRKLGDIGFHKRRLGAALVLGGLTVGGLFALAYLVQIVILNSAGQAAQLTLSAIDPKTGMAGGMLFALWLIVGNVVNAIMEEGLFRGVMLTAFKERVAIWQALTLQALLFASWHLVWSLKSYLTGVATLGDAFSEAAGLLIATGIGGLFYGYLFYKTGNLWSAILAHFINNTVLNILFIQTDFELQSGVEFGVFIAIFLVGYLLLIPLTGWLSGWLGFVASDEPATVILK